MKVFDLIFIILITLISALAGYSVKHLYTPFSALVGLIFSIIVKLLISKIKNSNAEKILFTSIGIIIGFIVGKIILSFLPLIPKIQKFYTSLNLIVLLTSLYLFSLIFYLKSFELKNLILSSGGYKPHKKEEKESQPNYKILDTSVIIDGRIADISETGFLEGILIIPRFVLNELQLIADSADSLKRQRGRRGLDILNKIKKGIKTMVQIVDDDFPEIKSVDEKLIELAKKYSAKIITNDYNLNKVAQIHGVTVLNINELANALRPVVLPGEELTIQIIREGKDPNQGVGYLEDGTMVVVEDGVQYIGKKVDVIVTSVLQTTAFIMIFAK